MSKKQTTREYLIREVERELAEATAQVAAAKEQVARAELEVQAAREARASQEKVIGGIHYVNLEDPRRRVAAGRALAAANEAYIYAFSARREVETDLARAKIGQPRVRECVGDSEGFGGNYLVTLPPGELPPMSQAAQEFVEGLRNSGLEEPIDTTPSKWRRVLAAMGLPQGVSVRTAEIVAKEKEARS